MAADGYVTAGYDSIHIDDCWERKNPPRDTNNQLVANATRFPNGMKSLADYVHQKGARFGLYTAESPTTCGGYPASANHEQIDAKTFADWGVDYLKVRPRWAAGRAASARVPRRGAPAAVLPPWLAAFPCRWTAAATPATTPRATRPWARHCTTASGPSSTLARGTTPWVLAAEGRGQVLRRPFASLPSHPLATSFHYQAGIPRRQRDDQALRHLHCQPLRKTMRSKKGRIFGLAVAQAGRFLAPPPPFPAG